MLTLDSWSRSHAVTLLATGTWSVLAGSALPLAVGALASTSLLLVRSRGEYTTGGSFGLANWITSLRLLLTLGAGALDGWQLGALVLTILALDGLDGLVARRFSLSSTFGAHFDMETDAMLVAMSTLLLYQRGYVGAWVLVAGALRYLYVLCLATWPARYGDAPRSRFGRYAFLVLVLGLAAPWLIGKPLGAPLAALGTAVVTLSFVRSFYYSYFG